jgi:hypothetical protein
MGRRNTRYVAFSLLKARLPSSATVVRLMMACNDMALANQSLGKWKTEFETDRGARAWGASLWAIRAQISHMYEGLDIIKAILADQQLMQVVERCDQRTQESFETLKAYVESGAKLKELEAIAGRIRNTVSFHYDESGKLVTRAIQALATQGKTSSVTRATVGPDWHFEVADRVVDEIVCGQIWKIPKNADQSAEADKIIGKIHDIFLLFLDFAGEFIWRYASAEYKR